MRRTEPLPHEQLIPRLLSEIDVLLARHTLREELENTQYALGGYLGLAMSHNCPNSATLSSYIDSLKTTISMQSAEIADLKHQLEDALEKLVIEAGKSVTRT